MTKRKGFIGPDEEVGELDGTFFEEAKRGRPPLPEGEGKQRVNMTLDRDVVERLRADGKMSTRVNALLRRELGI
ncbi:MAG: BrnA antitoxin family protein [Pseudomonadota bacterium]